MAEETAGTTVGSRQRRKRKWDEPAALFSAPASLPGALPFGAAALGAFSGVLPSYMNYFPGLATVGGVQGTTAAPVQQNAAAIVQKINQDILTSKGILLQSKIQDELIAREITINDAEAGVRYRLTKRQTQEEIQTKTGAVVITRGRYRPPNGPMDHEKPLYLHISAGVNLKDTAERIKAVDQAAAMVEEILKQVPQPQGLSLRSSIAGVSVNAGQVPVTANVYVGFEADPNFNIVGRIRGPNNQYLSHIAFETGASISLKGKDSGNADGCAAEESQQPLHLFISGDKAKSVEDAKILAENLLETIRTDFWSTRMQTNQPPSSVVLAISPPAMGAYPNLQTPQYPASVPQIPYAPYYPAVNATMSSAYGSGSLSPVLPILNFSPATVALPSEPTAPTLLNLYAGIVPQRQPPGKVYGAVPPPSELVANQPAQELGEAGEDVAEGRVHVRLRDKFSQSERSSNLNIAGTPTPTSFVLATSSSYTDNVRLPSHRLSDFQASQSATASGAEQFGAASSQVVATGQTQAGASSLYRGYGGIYPDVSPFQQVAQALQRPPLPVSVRPVSNSALAGTKAQSSSSPERHSERQSGQRRRFQEFRIVSSSDSARDDQQQGRRGPMPTGSEAFKVSQDQGSISSISARASRDMPPPPLPLKALSTSAPQSDASSYSMPLGMAPSKGTASAGSQLAEESDGPPGTGLKLVEYGEDEDTSPRSITPAPPRPFANGKPFWAA